MTPKEKARQTIDRLLTAAGWVVQSMHEINLDAATGVAVREFPLNHVSAGYLLAERVGMHRIYRIK